MKHGKMLRRLTALALSAAMAASSAFAVDWNVSKEKKAEPLNENNQTQISIRLPAEDYKPEIDVVFVIDDTHAGSGIFTEAVDKLLDELDSKENLSVNVGIVTFDAVARDWLDVTTNGDLKGLVTLDGNIEAIKNAIATELSSSGEGQQKKIGGSNTEWAVDMAKEMLDGGNGTEKHMVIFSDMYGYVYRGELEVEGKTYTDVPLSQSFATYDLGQLCITSPYSNSWNGVWNNRNQFDADYDYFFRVRNNGDESAWNNYWTIYQGLSTVPTAPSTSEFPHVPQYDEGLIPHEGVTPFEHSLVLTYDHITEARNNGIDVTIINNNFNPGSVEVQKIKNEMLDDLADNHGVSVIRKDTGNGDPFDESAVNEVFTTLRDQLIYLVDADSTVVDKMGHGTVTGKDGTEYTYYFDFVKVDSLTVGGETIYSSESTESKDAYTFGDHSTLTVKKGDGTSTFDSFDWKLNMPVEIDKPVVLRYTVELKGTILESNESFGQYDDDGSHGYSELFTNESAILSPVDSLGNTGEDEEFAKPTVAYGDGGTVDPNPDPEPEPTPGGDDDDKPSGGGDSDDRYEGADLTVVKVDEDGETIESNARFRIYKEQGSKTMWYKGNQSWSEDEEDAWIFNTSVGDGSFTAYDLKPGTYYIVEISAPEGYDLAEEPLEVEVESRDVTVEFVNSGDGVVTTPTKPVPDTGR